MLFTLSHPEKHRVFFNPFFRKYTKATVFQRNKLLMIGKCLFYIGNRYLLVAKNNIYSCIKPIGIIADMNPRFWPGCVKTEILQGFKTMNRNFLFLHGIYEKEEPVVL